MGSNEVTTHRAVDPVRVAALQLVTSSSVPGALAALAKLNVFEALARSSSALTAAEIAAQVRSSRSINVEYLSRLLRMASGRQVLKETLDDAGTYRYALEPLGRYLVEDPKNGSFVHLLLTYQHPGFLSTWAHVHESVQDDSVQPFARAHGGLNAWEFGKQNREFDTVFNKAMAGHTAVYMRAVLDAYRGFDDVKVLVDVGGGFGASLALITAKYPHIHGINFDQPHVIADCPPLPRVEHVGGNMFESVPKGDTIFMKYILHDWDDESCIKILKNCYESLPATGKVIALDNMLPVTIDFEGCDFTALLMDTHMLAFNDSGARERTESDSRKLGLAAGFKQVKVVCVVDHLAVLEFHKA